MDDILLAGNDKEYLLTVKAWLSSNFEMKNVGKAAYILGVKITRDNSKRMLALSQESYIKKIFERFHIQDCKSIDTPIVKDQGLSLKLCSKTRTEKKQMEKIPYSSVVGSLMYVMMCIRPDICFVVGMVSRY